MSNHVDRVRTYLRARAEDEYAADPIDTYRSGAVSLTTRDLDALCRDAERLAEVEDI